MSHKRALRAKVAAARRARADDDRTLARAGVREAVLAHCAAERLPAGSWVAAYEPLPSEPGSAELLAGLAAAGYRVMVPVVLADNDLDWSPWTASNADDAARVRLGRSAIADAALVLAPAFAVDPAGRRLGRGGGCYDRALARVPAGVAIAALLFDDEFLPTVPADSWDVPVTAVATPSGWRDLAT